MAQRTRVFEGALGRGLAALAHAPVNAPVLSAGFGFRPMGEAGTQPYEGITALGGAHPLDWPYPQLHAGQTACFSFGRTTVRIVTPGAGTYVSVPTYDARNPNTPKAIPEGGPWHVADWGSFYMATNGACLVYVSIPYLKVFVETQCYPRTLCNFRDRPVFGNVVGYLDEWESFWQTRLAETPTLLGVGMPNLRANSVAWGSLEGGDALMWFRRDLAETGYLGGANDSQNPLWLEKLRQNQVGYEDMPWNGDILAVKPLDDAVVVYGARNISILAPVNLSYPTFGRRELAPIGLAARGALGGDASGHVFVSTDGVLHRLDASGQTTRLEYGAQFAGVAAQSPLVTFDPYRDEYRIAAADRTYLLTRAGLVECPERVAACVPHEGVLYGCGEAVPGRTGFKAVSWATDLGTRGLKNVTGLERGAKSPAGIAVTVEYRNDLAGDWQTSPAPVFTREAYAPCHVTGVEFRFTVTAADYPHFDFLDVVWNTGGKARFGSL